MESTCLNLEGFIETFPDILFEKPKNDGFTGVRWTNRPEVYWDMGTAVKVNKETLDDEVHLVLLGPCPTMISFERKLQHNSLDKPKKFSGRDALGRLIKFIKAYDYGIPS